MHLLLKNVTHTEVISPYPMFLFIWRFISLQLIKEIKINTGIKNKKQHKINYVLAVRRYDMV